MAKREFVDMRLFDVVHDNDMRQAYTIITLQVLGKGSFEDSEERPVYATVVLEGEFYKTAFDWTELAKYGEICLTTAFSNAFFKHSQKVNECRNKF